MSIPRTMHRIALGSGYASDARIKACDRQLRKLHPDWEHVIWNDDDVMGVLVHPAIVSAFGDQVIDHWNRLDRTRPERRLAFKADLLRFAIVWLHGGLYLDSDLLFVRPVDPVADSHPNLLLARIATAPLFVSEAVIGAPKHSEALARMIQSYCAKQVDPFGIISPNLSRLAADAKWETVHERVFIPHRRQESDEDALHRVYPETVSVHLWGDRKYDIARIIKNAGRKPCLT